MIFLVSKGHNSNFLKKKTALFREKRISNGKKACLGLGRMPPSLLYFSCCRPCCRFDEPVHKRSNGNDPPQSRLFKFASIWSTWFSLDKQNTLVQSKISGNLTLINLDSNVLNVGNEYLSCFFLKYVLKYEQLNSLYRYIDIAKHLSNSSLIKNR